MSKAANNDKRTGTALGTTFTVSGTWTHGMAYRRADGTVILHKRTRSLARAQAYVNDWAAQGDTVALVTFK